jgi:hypothetical protein
MELNKIYNKLLIGIFLIATIIIAGSCKISYKFNGSNVDYTKTKTLSIVDFPNTAELVYAPLASEFSEKLRDVYTRNTRLQLLKRGGDMNIEGEIVGYELTPMGVSENTYAAQTKLTLTINVRFTNSKNPAEDFEKKYSAYQTFDSNNLLTDVQDELIKVMIEEITESIFNDTVANW